MTLSGFPDTGKLNRAVFGLPATGNATLAATVGSPAIGSTTRAPGVIAADTAATNRCSNCNAGGPSNRGT